MTEEHGTEFNNVIVDTIGPKPKLAEPREPERRGDLLYCQNRELSWLTFNERVLDQGSDTSVPLLERLNFVSIFWSNLQEFFMVRVGSITDLSLVKANITDSKTGMSPKEQIEAINERCHELYPIQERIFEEICHELNSQGITHRMADELDADQLSFLQKYFTRNVEPFLSPQIINPQHPFPHLENGKLYIVVRIDEKKKTKHKKSDKNDKGDKNTKKNKDVGADGATVGLIPLPHQCERIIKLPGDGFQFILLEHVIEMMASDIFSMYPIKHTNIICVTRNADLDANEGTDEADYDYREHMKRILKKRSRLAPVRLECERPLTPTLQRTLLDRLNLKQFQVYTTTVPLDMSYTYELDDILPAKIKKRLVYQPFSPQWPSTIDKNRSIIEQVYEKDILISYPYETIDAFVNLLHEAANDPAVISIKITLYRLAKQSHLAEALIAAAEAGKEVTALFELRARFDENNNIEWSQRFEEAGCNVIYGFQNYKVHSKICCITRQTPNGVSYITQLGTGNYNEKTAKLYTDFCFLTADEAFGRDAIEFFKNMGLETVSDNYDILRVAPMQIKPTVALCINQEIDKAKEGRPCGVFIKTNSITDIDLIDKLVEASQAGVPVTLFVRGISCILPRVKGYTDNIRVVSIVGRLLEHSRIFAFGSRDNLRLYLSSADLMTRNMEHRVEIAWPIVNASLREEIIWYCDTCLRDTAKLRELKPDGTYTALREFAKRDENGKVNPLDSQDALIHFFQERHLLASEHEAALRSNDGEKIINNEEAQRIAEENARPPRRDNNAYEAQAHFDDFTGQTDYNHPAMSQDVGEYEPAGSADGYHSPYPSDTFNPNKGEVNSDTNQSFFDSPFFEMPPNSDFRSWQGFDYPTDEEWPPQSGPSPQPPVLNAMVVSDTPRGKKPNIFQRFLGLFKRK
ncbi:MAG: polyphosphate kinase 1 [Eggerthellaceae bacterium]|jgi:polyphosphate kinase